MANILALSLSVFYQNLFNGILRSIYKGLHARNIPAWPFGIGGVVVLRV
jgi:hypothetical protein